MASSSGIEWTEMTWNPVTGCTKVSPGCKNCYAEVLSRRLQAMHAPGYERGFALTLQPQRLDQPRQRKKPTLYFVNSMSDLFHPEVPDEYIAAVMEVIRDTPQHKYQILTKRHERLRKYFCKYTCPANVWLGVSAENRKYGLPRIRALQKTPAAIRFVSAEPLVDDLGELDLDGIDWIIVGGESGKKARPMKLEWVENIRLQASEQGVAFFFKQWGTWGPDGVRRSKKANGRTLQGSRYDEMPVLGTA